MLKYNYMLMTLLCVQFEGGVSKPTQEYQAYLDAQAKCGQKTGRTVPSRPSTYNTATSEPEVKQ